MVQEEQVGLPMRRFLALEDEYRLVLKVFMRTLGPL